MLHAAHPVVAERSRDDELASRELVVRGSHQRARQLLVGLCGDWHCVVVVGAVGFGQVEAGLGAGAAGGDVAPFGQFAAVRVIA